MNYFSEEKYKGIINKIEEMAQIKKPLNRF